LNELNQRLQDRFLFSAADLQANRGGQFSPRQKARQGAAGSSMRLALGVFIFVMIGTIAIIAFSTVRSSSAASIGDALPSLLIGSAVVGVVILIGVFSSRRYMTAARVKQISAAKGVAQVGRVRADSASFEIKIGATKLRLVTQEQLDAFQPGVEYRVFYLAGPVPTILSAEVVGTEAESDAIAALEKEAPVEQDRVVQLQGRARPILYVLAALVLGIPLLAIATADLTGWMRWALWAGMFAVAIGFAAWALRRLSA
jgi:hypothetical protein